MYLGLCFEGQVGKHSSFWSLSFNVEVGEKLKTRPFSTDPRGHWAIDTGTKKIVNGLGECLDIKGDSDEDGAKLISYKFKDSANQQWHIDYV